MVRLCARIVLCLLVSISASAAETPVVTGHEIHVNGKRLDYMAEAGRVPLRDGSGRITGQMFYVAYRKRPVTAKRPITFLWNGGPGANSATLHMQAFGPRRLADDRLVDNDTTLLTDADLVFADPIGTGFSRAVNDEAASQFYSTLGDFAAMTQFVRNWLALHRATKAPVYLVGESFGVWRAAAVAQELEEQGQKVAGIVLISGGAGVGLGLMPHNLTVSLRTPDRTATALFHGKLAPDLGTDRDTAVAASTNWAQTVYAPALAQIAMLGEKGKDNIADELARWTGVKPGQIDHNTLVMAPRTYLSALLKDEGKTLDTFDMRRTREPVVDGAAIDHYLRHTLKYKTKLTYAGLEFAPGQLRDPTAPAPAWINSHWNYNSAPITPEAMASAMAGEGPPGSQPWALNAIKIDANLKVLVAAGLYDSLNSCAGNDALHARLPAYANGNFTMKCYLGGHMMYRDDEARHKLSADVKAFISGAAQH